LDDVARPIDLFVITVANHLELGLRDGLSVEKSSDDQLDGVDVSISSSNDCGFIIGMITAKFRSKLNARCLGRGRVVNLATQSQVADSNISSSSESSFNVGIGAIIILEDINAEINWVTSPCSGNKRQYD